MKRELYEETNIKNIKVLKEISKNASVVVTDDYPTYFVPQMIAKASGEIDTKYELVDKQLYDDVYNGKSVKKSYMSMNKTLFGNETKITQHMQPRTINPNMKFKEWN